MLKTLLARLRDVIFSWTSVSIKNSLNSSKPFKMENPTFADLSNLESEILTTVLTKWKESLTEEEINLIKKNKHNLKIVISLNKEIKSKLFQAHKSITDEQQSTE